MTVLYRALSDEELLTCVEHTSESSVLEVELATRLARALDSMAAMELELDLVYLARAAVSAACSEEV